MKIRCSGTYPSLKRASITMEFTTEEVEQLRVAVKESHIGAKDDTSPKPLSNVSDAICTAIEDYASAEKLKEERNVNIFE
jgi:hypothetical protein